LDLRTQGSFEPVLKKRVYQHGSASSHSAPPPMHQEVSWHPLRRCLHSHSVAVLEMRVASLCPLSLGRAELIALQRNSQRIHMRNRSPRPRTLLHVLGMLHEVSITYALRLACSA